MTQIWVSIGYVNGLLPDDTTPSPVLMNLIYNICSEITLLQLPPHFPGANESTRVHYHFQASEGMKNTTLGFLDHETTLVESVEFKIGLSVPVTIVALYLVIHFTYKSVIFLRNKWRISVTKKSFECE